MKIIKDTTNFYIEEKTAVAIGKFDGIHRGHRALLEQILINKVNGLKTAVFTFSPSPSVYFGNGETSQLTTIEEKRYLFESMGIDYLIEYPFHKAVAELLPEVFIKEILIDKMNAAFVAAGEDVSFGYRGQGDAGLLKSLGNKLGYYTVIIKKICYENTTISSTLVRKVIKEGNMELANNLLGAPYSVNGIVLLGNKLGRKLGMPTVNLLPPADKLLPPKGVYFSTIEYNDMLYRGVSNIGRKPTVGENYPIGVETYIFDFHEMIYGQPICVNLLHFERPELRFENVDKLKEAIAKNIFDGQAYFKKEVGQT